jgi:predicted transcriptional regulator
MSWIAVCVRLDPETYGLLKQVAKSRKEQVSVFVRRAVRRELARMSFLSKEDKKALEVAVNG